MTSITIIGSGNMARGIGTRAVHAGASLQIVDRDLAKAEALAADLAGSSAGDFSDSLTGDIVVLAVPFDAAREIVVSQAEALAHKVIIDITNPIDFSTFDNLVVEAGTSAAEELANIAPATAHIVKAFNTTFAGTLVAGAIDGIPLDVLVAGDDADAKSAVAEFVTASGLRSIDVGPLRRARELEAFQLLVMTLQANPDADAFNWDSGVKLVTA
jgi:8-hydroxy-5-deazaflavin:NADPH oxidoreductase